MAAARFTAWLAEGERTALRHAARRQGCSENYLLRVALRSMFFGESVPAHIATDITDSRNDSNGGNGDNEIVRPVG